MLKCLVVAICASSLITQVFSAPGYEDLRESQSTGQDGTDQSKTITSRRQRETWGGVDFKFIDASLIDSNKLKDLQSKESSLIAPINDVTDHEKNFQQPETNVETIAENADYIIYKLRTSCSSKQDCTRHKNYSPNGITEKRITMDTYEYQNYNHDTEQYSRYSEESQPPPVPPPPDDRGPPGPGPHHPPPPPPPPTPPPPPPHHYPPPPPHHPPPPPYYPPPPPYGHPPPPPHHHPPPPPPPPPPDYRSNYYDQPYSSYHDSYYNRPPPPPPPPRPPQPPPPPNEKKSGIGYDERQTRQSPYYDRPPRYDQQWPPPPPRDGPPPWHGRPPPYEPSYGGHPPRHGGPPPYEGSSPPRHGGPPPYNRGPPSWGREPPPNDNYGFTDRPNRESFDDGPSRYDRRPPPPDNRRPRPPSDSQRPPPDRTQPYDRAYDNNRFGQYDERQNQMNDNSAKLIDANQNRNSNNDHNSDSSFTTLASTVDNQYQLDVRFANGAPTQKTLETINSHDGVTTTRPFLFQAAPVTPED